MYVGTNIEPLVTSGFFKEKERNKMNKNLINDIVIFSSILLPALLFVYALFYGYPNETISVLIGFVSFVFCLIVVKWGLNENNNR